MKKIICVFIASALLLCCGCRKQTAEFINISVSSPELNNQLLPIIKAYEKQNNITVKVISSKKQADIFEFNIGNFDKVSEKCLDLSQSRLSDYIVSKDLSVSRNGHIYALPLKINCLTFVADKSFNDNIQNSSFYCKKELVPELLSLPLYKEFSENDDYSFPLFAVKAAKQIALIFDRELINRLSFSRFSAESLSADVIFCNISEPEYAENNQLKIINIPSDNESLPLIFAKPQNYFAINNTVSKQKKDIALSFLEYIAQNGEKYSLTTPFKQDFPTINNSKSEQNSPLIKQAARLLSGGECEIIPVLSSAYPEGFADTVISEVEKCLVDNKSPLSAKEALRAYWKKSREANQAQ